MKNIHKKVLLIVFVLMLVIIDQITKNAVMNIEDSIVVIPNLLNITLVNNYGAVFGLAQGSNIIMAIITGSICVAIVAFICACMRKKEKVSFALYLVLAGGIGNFIDRIYRGFVVDFIDTPFIATFNIADSLVVIGAIWLIVEYGISIFKETNNNE